MYCPLLNNSIILPIYYVIEFVGGISMIINHNISALNTLNRLQKNNKTNSSILEKLSSGLQINKASDDSAGLAISEKMRGQIRGLEQAQRNIQDGISLIQTAESGLASIQTPPLQRLRELAIQASNDTLTSADRKKIQEEVEQIKSGINEIANKTEFNNRPLLNHEVDALDNDKNSDLETVTKITTTIPYKSTYNIVENINDTLKVSVDGISTEVKISADNYTAESFINTLNNSFVSNGINLKASFSDSTKNIEFTSTDKTLIFDSVKGSLGADFTSPSLRPYNKTGGVIIDGFPTLDPEITITTGINDTLTFNINSTTYSITINPGTYRIDDKGTEYNDNSPLLNELNSKFIDAGIPVTANLLYLRGDPPLKGAVLRLTALSNIDNSSNLSEGNYTFGNMGGNAKDTLFQNFLDGWTLIDSSTLINGTVNVTNAKVQGGVDLSNGLEVITGKNDKLNFTINHKSESITINAGNYNANQLIEEINTQFSNKSINATAQLTMSNRLEIIASNYGDSIYNFSGNAVDELLYYVDKLSFNVIQAESNSDQDINNNDLYQGILQLQIGANSGESLSIELTDATTTALGIDDIDFSTRNGAESAISKIDNALKTVSSERSKFGAYQNRLEHIHNNAANYEVNLTSAESRIRDANIAKQMMKLTKSQILSQASQTMLAQSINQPQKVLQLLK